MRGYGGWCLLPGNWPFGGLFTILIAVLLVFLLISLLKRTTGKPSQAEEALEILKKRYAHGEIDRGTFDRMKRDISG